MKLLPVMLTARQGNFERYQKRKRNKRFLQLAKKIHARDKNTCRYCGFQSNKYLQVVNHNHNYSNNKPSNMVTACTFCAQCFFLDSIGRDGKSGGYIIYLPEISQADLNHFCRVLFSSMLRETPYKGKLQTAFLSFKDRSQIVEQIFGPESSKPEIFGQSLIDSNFSKKQLTHPIFNYLRLLPERNFFSEEIIYWKSTIFESIPL